jgi:hypothetical protein
MKEAGNDRIKAIIPLPIARKPALREMKRSWFDGVYFKHSRKAHGSTQFMLVEALTMKWDEAHVSILHPAETKGE